MTMTPVGGTLHWSFFIGSIFLVTVFSGCTRADPYDNAVNYLRNLYQSRQPAFNYYYSSYYDSGFQAPEPFYSNPVGGIQGKSLDGRYVVDGAEKSYKPMKKTTYVPVVVKKKKKKQKILSINKGVFVPGGTQVFGKFKSLKACMKACAASPSCFAGDYNPWVAKCYFHSNVTACNSMSSHSKITHFKKVPCTVTDAPRGRIILGAHLFGTVEQKGIDDISSCLKKCANLGPGISSEATAPTALAADAIFGNIQICYGINYDFGSHKCYFIIGNFPRLGAAADRGPTAICPIAAAEPVKVPIDLQPSPSTVTIILCPPIGAAEEEEG